MNKFVQKSETIYPLLPTLPEQMKKSWYEFDNFYSDNCFEEIYEIISSNNPFEFYDIGGNTGKFERVCLKNNSKVTMLDLKENIEIVKKQITLKGCDFIPVDILKDKKMCIKKHYAISETKWGCTYESIFGLFFKWSNC